MAEMVMLFYGCRFCVDLKGETFQWNKGLMKHYLSKTHHFAKKGLVKMKSAKCTKQQLVQLGDHVLRDVSLHSINLDPPSFFDFLQHLQ